jgi:hypothetical protein
MVISWWMVGKIGRHYRPFGKYSPTYFFDQRTIYPSNGRKSFVFIDLLSLLEENDVTIWDE